MANLKEFIAKQNWIFAKTYADRAPHEYIVRHKHVGTDEEFMEFARMIQEKGRIMYFWGYPNRYVFAGNYYYWVMKDSDDDPTMVINRALFDNYKFSIAWRGTI